MLARGSEKIRTCSCPSKTLERESTRKTKAAYLRRSLRLRVRVWDWVWRSAARSSKDTQAVWSSPKRALRVRHSRSPCLLCLLATHREPLQTRHLRRTDDRRRHASDVGGPSLSSGAGQAPRCRSHPRTTALG